MTESAVVVDGVSKRFRLYRERNQSLKAALMRGKRASFDDFWALKDVSFEIPGGSTFGLIGENGSGKSTLLKCIAGILRPNDGSVRTVGSIAALLELGSGFHQELSGRENIFLNGSILGMTKKEVESRFDEIVDFAGVEEFIDQPVKNYSSGMYMRLGFSVAINVDPDILLVDEVLAVGDAAFQDKCMQKFLDFRRAGKTVVVVSHSMGSMRNLCDYAAWLDHGTLTRSGRADVIVDEYIDKTHVVEEVIADAAGVADSRWGSGEARITKIEMLNVYGESASQFRSGDPATIRLHYHANEVIERPVFGFAMENRQGFYVWAHNSRDSFFEVDRIDGDGYVDLRFDRLAFQPDSFDLIASIVDHTTTHQFDFMRHCLHFEVLPPKSNRESGGIVALNGGWSIVPGGRSEGCV